ncbi:cytochrome bc complex cytochrome b subunit [Thermoplasma sp.]|uniref:cytochrome b n=1 Tax=Thermoplasma sp. TaxID=1973142 RepID=UPI0025F566A1|nr:cytochrome bc complex cytochrome b subunit [Thermoplasma sp.]
MEKNEYDLTKLMEEDTEYPGSYKILLRPISRKEFRLDYWTGSFLMAAVAYLAVSGMLLFYYYQSGHPYSSTIAITSTVPFGYALLTSHLYMAYAMIVLVYAHMLRNYFIGAYKGKWRWLQWILGVVLFILVYTTAIVGYMLTYTYISVAATHVGELLIERSIIGRLLPGLSNWLISILVGNGTTAQTFSHILGLHVMILSTLIIIVAFIHFFLFEKSGPYGVKYEKNEKLVPWFPVNLLYTVFLSLMFIGVILVFSAAFPQVIPDAYGLPVYGTTPFPDWYILPVYKLMDTAGYGLTTGGVPLVILFFVFLFILPFIDRYSGTHPLDRPAITAFGVFMIIGIPVMAIWGASQPGLSQTRLLTMFMWWGITFVSFATVYAMRFARKDGEDK